ncbi:MAG: DUF1800 domain-containing protein [Pseudomonadota bacterium]
MRHSETLCLGAVGLSLALMLGACGGGGSSGTAVDSAPDPDSQPSPPAETLADTEAARFLSQATFGPTPSEVDRLMDLGLEAWFLEQLALPPSLHLRTVLDGFPTDGQFLDGAGAPIPEVVFLASDSLWRTYIEAPDQLRQRMAFALSQILVISADSRLGRTPQTVAHYADLLTSGAFGNYRDLLHAVTYSPAMAVYLTYLRNEKADPNTGRVPDENYAREILQLFTTGLVALNDDGTPVIGSDGGQQELFDNADITGLAKVFTGLSFTGAGFRQPIALLPEEAYYSPLTMFDNFHTLEEKHFLSTTIPAGTGGDESIRIALDTIFAHPNLGPFIGRQLIQRFVTSDPADGYVRRVAEAFDGGVYPLPSGTFVGSGDRGDLSAVIAAVLFDPEARGFDARLRETFGKLREPVLRFTHWARAFTVNSAAAANQLALRNTGGSDALGQHPYRSPSVFNFYRPGYVAAGGLTAEAGLTAPELQITNATSIVGYPNFITQFALELQPQTPSPTGATFVPDYSRYAAVAGNSEALLDAMDQLLTHGTLQSESRDRIVQIVSAIGADDPEGLDLRARVASILVMTSPEYIVLR